MGLENIGNEALLFLLCRIDDRIEMDNDFLLKEIRKRYFDASQNMLILYNRGYSGRPTESIIASYLLSIGKLDENALNFLFENKDQDITLLLDSLHSCCFSDRKSKVKVNEILMQFIDDIDNIKKKSVRNKRMLIKLWDSINELRDKKIVFENEHLQKSNTDKTLLSLPDSFEKMDRDRIKEMIVNYKLYSDSDKRRILLRAAKERPYECMNYFLYDYMMFLLDNPDFTAISIGYTNIILKALKQEHDMIEDFEELVKRIKDWYFWHDNLEEFGWYVLEDAMRKSYIPKKLDYESRKLCKIGNVLLDLIEEHRDMPIELFLELNSGIVDYTGIEAPPLNKDSSGVGVSNYRTERPADFSSSNAYSLFCSIYGIVEEYFYRNDENELVLSSSSAWTEQELNLLESMKKKYDCVCCKLSELHISGSMDLEKLGEKFEDIIFMYFSKKIVAGTLTESDIRLLYTNYYLDKYQILYNKTIHRAIECMDFSCAEDLEIILAVMLSSYELYDRLEISNVVLEKIKRARSDFKEIKTFFNGDVTEIFSFYYNLNSLNNRGAGGND